MKKIKKKLSLVFLAQEVLPIGEDLNVTTLRNNRFFLRFGAD